MFFFRNLTEEQYQKKLRKIKEKNIQKKYRQALKDEDKLGDKKIFETSKVIMVYLLVLFNVILVYSMIAMWSFQDLSYLGVLISDIAAQVVAYAIYCLKAYHGKKQEEHLKFEREKLSLSEDDESLLEDELITE